MKYKDLKVYFEAFHLGSINKTEVAFAVALWQRAGAML
jgi:hypothetical protein